MKNFEYASPKTKVAAAGLLNGDTAILAGGTDLLSLMKEEIVTPKRVVNIKEIRELKGIQYTAEKGLRIGALVTLAEILEEKKIQEEYPSLVQAAEGVRSPQIQNMGTVGGDLCQRPRCWYFRNGFGLLAMKDGKSLIPDGENRNHAILGNGGPAYFVNPSSFAPTLIALNARLKIFSPKGEREITVAEFFQSPANESEREYKLAVNEFITDILVPPAAGQKSAIYEVREKEALDWPLAAAAATLQMTGDRVDSATVVLGHVAPTPWVSDAAASALKGKSVSAEVAEAAGEAAVADAKPLSRNRHKVRIARTAVKRAILKAAGLEG